VNIFDDRHDTSDNGEDIYFGNNITQYVMYVLSGSTDLHIGDTLVMKHIET